jgi:flagellar basal-body rod protein FlgC
MGMFQIFDVAGQGMSAQSIRLNTISSNMANASSVSSSLDQTYRARHPVFETVMGNELNESAFDHSDYQTAGVRVAGIVESNKPLEQKYSPNHPMANEEGYIFLPNVNMVQEMANMISASRTYQMNVQMLSTAKQMMQETIKLGR